MREILSSWLFLISILQFLISFFGFFIPNMSEGFFNTLNGNNVSDSTYKTIKNSIIFMALSIIILISIIVYNSAYGHNGFNFSLF